MGKELYILAQISNRKFTKAGLGEIKLMELDKCNSKI